METLSQLLRRACLASALAALSVLFLVVAGSILARILFDLSSGTVNLMVPGAVELAAYAMLIFVFGAIPSAVPQGLVRVDLVIQKLPVPVARLLYLIWTAVLVPGACTLAWLFANSGLLAAKRGASTQDLEWPLWIFYLVITVQTGCFALISLARFTTLFQQFAHFGKAHP